VIPRKKTAEKKRLYIGGERNTATVYPVIESSTCSNDPLCREFSFYCPQNAFCTLTPQSVSQSRAAVLILDIREVRSTVSTVIRNFPKGDSRRFDDKKRQYARSERPTCLASGGTSLIVVERVIYCESLTRGCRRDASQLLDETLRKSIGESRIPRMNRASIRLFGDYRGNFDTPPRRK
jgi:hypothetical protein